MHANSIGRDMCCIHLERIKRMISIFDIFRIGFVGGIGVLMAFILVCIVFGILVEKIEAKTGKKLR